MFQDVLRTHRRVSLLGELTVGDRLKLPKGGRENANVYLIPIFLLVGRKIEKLFLRIKVSRVLWKGVSCPWKGETVRKIGLTIRDSIYGPLSKSIKIMVPDGVRLEKNSILVERKKEIWREHASWRHVSLKKSFFKTDALKRCLST